MLNKTRHKTLLVLSKEQDARLGVRRASCEEQDASQDTSCFKSQDAFCSKSEDASCSNKLNKTALILISFSANV